MALPQLPKSVVLMMASKEHRLWHYLWHGLRSTWERLTPEQQQSVLDVYPGWQPPRPSLDANGNRNRDNNSGEDFLYMHRIMMIMVNGILAKEGNPNYPWIQGWKKIPRPWDNDYPVPPSFSFDPSYDETLKQIKSEVYFWRIFAVQEQQFTDPDYLRSVTLGQLGADMEGTIHNGMHVRWSAKSPVGYRPNSALTDSVNESWNQPEYNWLFDTYSSHVNPIFWKLHGWVDDRIEDWKRINKADDYEWKGTWIGNPLPHSIHHHNHNHNHNHNAQMETQGDIINKMEQLASILAQTGKWRGFYIDT
ncbi:hypothetical protein [Bacillus thuringiensis]|uniref:hypothetical protein n=1 Tax=Bacillus thuringiensis TaxID=1428 RepID=UPI0001A1FB22|nr:hypothetical protein [Bacillus thuringiensis]EEM80209.1 Tat (Twin-arginine translocation) pathway signal sequence domain protein [Bacillus thuringiensis serovar huazhongensis BGSC 4BD1]